ncbi:phosphate/phosphite/phosphonate ABC transporter substrate-binding protein [Fusobacterium sp. MFO224]|uniref:phosphate/phosphite/phosphonate ABC transporter substrate-binding protein n=1 Tax=Fusobacterium sp. MFO224 TaxID=3378070 RepID=UPI003852A6E1
MKKKFVGIAIVILTILATLTGCGQKKENDTLVMGFVPLIDGDKLVDSVKPLSKILTEAIGKEVEVFTATNYVGVVEAMGSSKVDFGIIPPFAYVLANKESGAQVILKALNKHGESFYRSEFVVKKNSNINSLDDIKGKRVAFVDPSSSSGYLYPGAYLKKNGIDIEKDIQVVYSGGHDKSIQLLLNNDVDLIAVFEGARSKYKKEFKNVLEDTKVFAYSEKIPYISVTVRGDMDEKTKEQIKDGLLKGLNSKEAKEITARLFSIHGFEEATDSDFDSIRTTAKLMNINLEK